MRFPYEQPVCRGAFALGTACGTCERCRNHVDAAALLNMPPDSKQWKHSLVNDLVRLYEGCGGGGIGTRAVGMMLAGMRPPPPSDTDILIEIRDLLKRLVVNGK